MPRQVRIRSIALAGIVLVCSPSLLHANEWKAEQTASVDRVIARFLTRRSPDDVIPPSISIAISRNGQLLLAKAYGSAREGMPANEHTAYRIGSLTKQFTAAAVLRLIEKGAATPVSGNPLTLDTPMSDIFESVENWQSQDEPPITMRSLLNMTSNLPNFTRRPPENTDPWGAVPAPRLLAEVKKMAPHGWPNSFEYNNTGYFLLAQIVSRAALPGAQHAYRDWVRRETIEKAQLGETGFADDATLASQMAEPHYHRRPAFAKPDWLIGSGDMASTACDLFRWNRALMAGEVLDRSSLSDMFSDSARVTPTTYYGMGWFVEHSDAWDLFSHSGSVPGFTSYNAIRKRPNASDWQSVTLLTNSDGVEGLDDLAAALFDLIDVASATADAAQ